MAIMYKLYEQPECPCLWNKEPGEISAISSKNDRFQCFLYQFRIKKKKNLCFPRWFLDKTPFHIICITWHEINFYRWREGTACLTPLPPECHTPKRQGDQHSRWRRRRASEETKTSVEQLPSETADFSQKTCYSYHLGMDILYSKYRHFFSSWI